MYPPMGFKPLGNQGDASLRYPAHALQKLQGDKTASGTPAQLGADLDARLSALYAWCAAEGVPIMAHAADSNGAGPCFSKRADTANWAPVVGDGAHAGYKDIRVRLAHFGSFNAAQMEEYRHTRAYTDATHYDLEHVEMSDVPAGPSRNPRREVRGQAHAYGAFEGARVDSTRGQTFTLELVDGAWRVAERTWETFER